MANHVLVDQVVPEGGASEHLHLIVVISSIQGAICQVNRLIVTWIEIFTFQKKCKTSFDQTWSNSSLLMLTRATSQRKGTAARMEMTRQNKTGFNQT